MAQTKKRNRPAIMAAWQIALLLLLLRIPAFTYAFPVISSVSDPQTLYGGNATATLWAEVAPESAEKHIIRVWADIYPPGTSSDPVTVELRDPENDGRYEGIYENFATEGDYSVPIRAEDSAGEVSHDQTSVFADHVSPAPDEYENDDTRDQAGVIIICNPNPQHHDFHDPGDADWVKFYGIAEQKYVIRASNLGEACEIVAEIHDKDSSEPLKMASRSGADKVEMEYSPSGDGIYYVRLSNNSEHYGEATAYDFEVTLKNAHEGSIVQGTVEDRFSRRPVHETAIRALTLSSLSDESGGYGILLSPGCYILFAEKMGYESLEKEITVTETEDGVMEATEADPKTPPGRIRKMARQEDSLWDGVIEMVPFDINGDGSIGLADAIIALRTVAGNTHAQDQIHSDYASSDANMSRDGKVGTEEAVHILRYISESAK